mgnify:FL=1
MDHWNPRVWHRRVSRPVVVWMGVFIAVGLVHTLVPEPRWLLIHIFTLGVLGNSIVVWSQNLTERFLQSKLPNSARPAQLWRTRMLNVGVVLLLAGQLAAGWGPHWVVTWSGVSLVIAAVGWHGAAIAHQLLQTEKTKRFRPIVAGYVASAVSLVVGACFGAALALDLPGVWQQRVLLAHVFTNVGGFVGLAAMASLTILFPAMWRLKGILAHPVGLLWTLAAGISIAVCGALFGSNGIACCGVLVYAAAWVYALQQWLAGVLSIVRDPQGRFTYYGLSALCAVAWIVGSLVWMGVSLASSLRGPLVLAPPTLPLLAGFVAQLLIGTMSYLMPTTIGGGPAAVRAGLAELDRAGVWRVAVFNIALVGWLAAPHAIARIVFSLIVFMCLAAFIPLMVRGVRAQRAVITAAGTARSP